MNQIPERFLRDDWSPDEEKKNADERNANAKKERGARRSILHLTVVTNYRFDKKTNAADRAKAWGLCKHLADELGVMFQTDSEIEGVGMFKSIKWGDKPPIPLAPDLNLVDYEYGMEVNDVMNLHFHAVLVMSGLCQIEVNKLNAVVREYFPRANCKIQALPDSVGNIKNYLRKTYKASKPSQESPADDAA